MGHAITELNYTGDRQAGLSYRLHNCLQGGCYNQTDTRSQPPSLPNTRFSPWSMCDRVCYLAGMSKCRLIQLEYKIHDQFLL